MKTNGWLAYLLDEHRAVFVADLGERLAEAGRPVPAGAVAAWAAALHDDLAADTPDRTGPALSAPAGITGLPRAELAPFWDRAEALLRDWIAAEPEMTAGAKRLAYLRLSTFGNELRRALRAD